jgi:hypothetical protein
VTVKTASAQAFTIEEKIKIITISRGAVGVWTTAVVVMSQGMAISRHARGACLPAYKVFLTPSAETYSRCTAMIKSGAAKLYV